MSKRPDVYERVKTELEFRKREDEYMSAFEEYCENCRARLADDKSAWVRRTLVGDPEDPDVEEESYCERCVSIDEARRFQGSGPPEMERL